MKTNIIATLLVLLLSACGNGQWGAELQLSVDGIDENGNALAPGVVIALPQSGWILTLERACLAVEMAVITPAGAEGAVGSDCFCHGDPPECHGDCGTLADTGSTNLVAELDAVVDLLAGPTSLGARGTAPGDYERLSLVLGGDHADHLPAACADMDGRTLWVQGTLTNTATAMTWTLTVDLRTEVVTEPFSAEPVATATTDRPASLLASLRLDLALAHVDFAAIAPPATSEITIGGDNDQNPDAVDAIGHGLSHADSYTAVGP